MPIAGTCDRTTADEIRVRSFEPADLAAIVTLWEDCDLTKSYNPPEKDIALCAETPSSELFVGLIERRMVATVMAGSDGHRGWLYYLAVAADTRDRGYGRHMVRHAEDWLASHGVRKVQLMIRPNNEGARRFYERIGYEDNPCAVLQCWLVDQHAQ